MSEFFELPVASNQVYISQNLIERNKEKGVSNSDVLEHAARAINNVDALADELEKLLAHIAQRNGRVTEAQFQESLSTLNTYRGTK